MLGRNLQSLQYHCQWQQLVFQLELGYQHHGESHIYTCVVPTTTKRQVSIYRMMVRNEAQEQLYNSLHC